MKNFKTCLKRTQQAEDGLTLIELMVSIVIIVTVLLASAFALNAAFKAQTVSETKSRAVEIAREQSEKAKQRSYIETRLVVAADPRPGEVVPPDVYKGEKMITKTADRINDNGDLDNIGFVHRITQEQNGTKFTILTYVTQVTSPSFDSAGDNIQLSKKDMALNSNTPNVLTTVAAPIVKRITVVVEWTVDGQVNSTSTSVVRAPHPTECIPPRVEANGGAPASQWAAQERIQACEEKK
jgi:prepilin-type N-terminal cleavage/methylation domain-containing protein